MRQLATYAFTNARVRAMLSYLIQPDVISRLLDTRDLKEALDLLKGVAAYTDILEKTDPDSPDIPSLEKTLRKNDLDIYEKIRDSLPGKSEKAFVQLLIERYELDELKVVLRMWHNKAAVNLDDYLLGRTIAYKIDFRRIFSARTIEDIIALLRKMPYAAPMLRARDKFKKTSSLFYIEASLDLDYYERLTAAANKLSMTDRYAARSILSIEIDNENMHWLIKAVKFYSIGRAEIIDWIIPGGGRLRKKAMRNIADLDGFSKLMEGIAAGPYIPIKDMAEDNIRLIEGFLYEVLSKEIRKALGGFPFTIGTILGYMILKRRETRNIVSLLYAKKYGMKRDELEQLLTI